jgi:peptide deformylase
MLKSLDHYKGIGLACTQLGLPIRMLVAHVNNTVYTMCNPIILEKSGEYDSKEGCLSIPGYWDNVTRSNTIVINYHDIRGRKVHDIIMGFNAAVIQHEIDHLDGVLFIDHLSDIKQARARKKVDFWKRKNSLKHKTKRQK